jgi:hypothetical protein
MNNPALPKDESLLTKENKKIVMTPLPSDPSIIPSIYCIELDCDEEVEWHWLELPNGNRVVTDYKIICKKTTK